MTGSHTQNRVFSRLTLAIMEDSGWYRANYSLAQRLDWGRGLGCDFVMKSCKFWMDTQRERWGQSLHKIIHRFFFYSTVNRTLKGFSEIFLVLTHTLNCKRCVRARVSLSHCCRPHSIATTFINELCNHLRSHIYIQEYYLTFFV